MNWRFEMIDEVTSEDLQRLKDRPLKFPKDRILAGKMNREVISDVPPESFSVLGNRNEGCAAVKIPGILLLPTEHAKELTKVLDSRFESILAACILYSPVRRCRVSACSRARRLITRSLTLILTSYKSLYL